MENLKLGVFDYAGVHRGQVFLSVDFDDTSWDVDGDPSNVWRDHIGWSDESDKWFDIHLNAIQLWEAVMTDDGVHIFYPLILWRVRRGLPRIQGKGRIYQPKDAAFREGKVTWIQTSP